MIQRTVAIPAKYLPALDAALDKLMGQIEADSIPTFGQDDSPPDMVLTLKIERPTERDRVLLGGGQP